MTNDPREAQARVELTNARLAVNDWHVCLTQEELERWRQAQQRLIDAATALAKLAPETRVPQDEINQENDDAFTRANVPPEDDQARPQMARYATPQVLEPCPDHTPPSADPSPSLVDERAALIGLLEAVLECETYHDERGHAFLAVPARSLNGLAATIKFTLNQQADRCPFS